MQGGFILFLGTKNLNLTHRFYTDLMVLNLVIDQGTCRIYQVPGEGFIGFCEHLDVCRIGRSPILTFVTDEVDQVYMKLKQSGADIPEAPVHNEKFGIYHFFVKDPQGYTVEVQSFSRPEDARRFTISP